MEKMTLNQEVEGELSTSLEKIEKLCRNIRKTHAAGDVEIGLSFIFMNLFPTLQNWLSEFSVKRYIAGYNSALQSKDEPHYYEHICNRCNYSWWSDDEDEEYCAHCGAMMGAVNEDN